jgi:hypothetical protein
MGEGEKGAPRCRQLYVSTLGSALGTVRTTVDQTGVSGYYHVLSCVVTKPEAAASSGGD